MQWRRSEGKGFSFSFEEGKRLLETQEYHVAILDIMGVKGYALLDVANQVGTPALIVSPGIPPCEGRIT
ncbi:MAG: hypothetical protein ACLFUT_08915 [Desulfobacteraceae bacterium]